jgi:hypothetical protein
MPWIGYDIRTVLELLGHRSVEATMISTHVLNRGGKAVRSPLDDRSSVELLPPMTERVSLREVACQHGAVVGRNAAHRLARRGDPPGEPDRVSKRNFAT